MTCMLQRIHVLQERLLHLRFSCPIQQEPSPAGTVSLPAPAAAADAGSSPMLDASKVEEDTAAELRALADSLVAVAASVEKDVSAGQQPAPTPGTDDSLSEGSEVLQRVLLSAGLLLQHASSSQSARLLRLLLSSSAAVLPYGGDAPTQSSGMNEPHQAGRGMLHSAALLEEAELDSEWVHAAASIVHEALTAACAPLLSNQKVQQERSAASAAASRPKRKGKGAAPAADVPQTPQSSQCAEKLKGLMQSIGVLAAPRESDLRSNGGSEGLSGVGGLLDVLQSCSSEGREAISGSAWIASLSREAATALRQIARLFTRLAAMPPQWFAARAPTAAQLVSIALLAQAALLTLIRSRGSAAEPGTDASSSGAVSLDWEVCWALQAAHSFLAAAARSEARDVLRVLSQLADVRLDWPFIVAELAGNAAARMAGTAGASWQDSSAQSMLHSSAAIMGSTVKHSLTGGGMQLQGTSQYGATADGELTVDRQAALATYSRVERLLEGLAAQMIARDSDRGSVSVKPEAALQIQTLAASLAASMATAPAYSKRRAASSIVAGEPGLVRFANRSHVSDKEPLNAFMFIRSSWYPRVQWITSSLRVRMAVGRPIHRYDILCLQVQRVMPPMSWRQPSCGESLRASRHCAYVAWKLPVSEYLQVLLNICGPQFGLSLPLLIFTCTYKNDTRGPPQLFS